MNYNDAISFIRTVHNNGTKLGLERTKRLTELLGNPQEDYRIVHVAGTNGKGSTCNMIHDVLVASGYKTGLFISPHLEEYTERIQINKVPIDRESLTRIAEIVKEKIDIMRGEGIDELTEFEVITAIGFKYFQEQKIDVLVLEVGMGGRYDASNAIHESILSVITSVGLDHTEFLGNTLKEVAYEKAGIIKENSQVAVYPQSREVVDVILQEAGKKHAALYLADSEDARLINSDLTGQTFEYRKKDVFDLPEVRINFLGEHQLRNAVTAVLALELLKKSGFSITEENILKGLAGCTYAGRFEVISKHPLIILDGGHNKDGIEVFAKTVSENLKGRKLTLFYGMLRDKNPETVLDYLHAISKKIYTLTPDSDRAMDSAELAQLIKNRIGIEAVPLKDDAEIIPLVESLEEDEAAAFVGSLYMIGKIRTLIRKHITEKAY